MSLTSRLKGKAIAAWLGPTGEVARRTAHALRNRGTTTRLDVYFDIADAWSFLVAQVAARLVDAYGVELAFHTVTPPASDVAPQPLLRVSHAVRDCQLLAEYYDLAFPTSLAGKPPDSGLVRDVGTVLVRDRAPRDQLAAALELGHVLWRNDRKALAPLLGKHGQEAHGAVAPILNAAYSELRDAGHYQGGMLAFAGGWYSLDRLGFLEDAIAQKLGVEVKRVVHVRPIGERGPKPLAGGAANDDPAKPAARPRLTCEMWFSFRSPFSYLALEQIEAVLAPYDVPLALRPIAPMVARGMAMPSMKRMYLALDAKREADRHGIAFGEICDPLGAGVDHCLAIAQWAGARSPADALAFARSAMRGIWAEARDTTSYVDLRDIVERAGLPWHEAKHAIGDPAGAKQAQQNANDLAVYGLWGVPSFRIGELVTWGQDRVPLIADRLRRHFAYT